MGVNESIDGTVESWQLRDADLDLGPVALGLRLLWAGRLLEASLDRAAAAAGFSKRGDYEVLALLNRMDPKGISPVDVAQTLRISPSGVTGRLDRLQNENLLVRRQDPTDRRSVLLEITETGRARVSAAFDASAHVHTALFDGVGGRSLGNQLRRIIDQLEEHLRTPARPTVVSD